MGQYYQFKVAQKSTACESKYDYVTDYNVQKSYIPFGWKFWEFWGMEERSMKVLLSLIHNERSRCMIVWDYDSRNLWTYDFNSYDQLWNIIEKKSIDMVEDMITVKGNGYVINWSDGTYIDLQEQAIKLQDKDLYNPLALLLLSEPSDYYMGWNEYHIWRWLWDIIEYRERNEITREELQKLEDRTKVFFFYQSWSEDEWKYVSYKWEAKLEDWKELEIMKKEIAIMNDRYNGIEKVI